MIPERMLEFLCLGKIWDLIPNNYIEDYIYNKSTTAKIGDNKINIDKLSDRSNKLLNELLEPYVLDSNSKES